MVWAERFAKFRGEILAANPEGGGVVTVSFGVATIYPTPQEEAETQVLALVGRADAALYKAKADGRNRVVGPRPRVVA